MLISYQSAIWAFLKVSCRYNFYFSLACVSKDRPKLSNIFLAVDAVRVKLSGVATGIENKHLSSLHQADSSVWCLTLGSLVHLVCLLNHNHCFNLGCLLGVCEGKGVSALIKHSVFGDGAQSAAFGSACDSHQNGVCHA